jgi:hypothetical protein
MPLEDRHFWEDEKERREIQREDNSIFKLFPPKRSPVWFYETLVPHKEHFSMSGVVSMLDKEHPVVQSFTDGDRINTFVTLSSVPIPYSIFVFTVSRRMVQYLTKAHFNDRGENAKFSFDDETVQYLSRVFKNGSLHSKLRAMAFSVLGSWANPTGLVEDTILALFDDFQEKYDDGLRVQMFREFIDRVDMAYADSLEHIIEIA